MVFLIEYDRRGGRLVTFERFDDADLAAAEQARLELELASNRMKTGAEIVLLQAESEDALRMTHRRYFQTPQEIVESSLRPGR